MSDSQQLVLTPFQIRVARDIGGLTFRPCSGNKVCCNQAPGLGHMTSRQADRLRAQVWPRNPVPKEAPVVPMREFRRYGAW